VEKALLTALQFLRAWMGVWFAPHQVLRRGLVDGNGRRLGDAHRAA
jgi:hypothetical protein